MLGVDLGMVPGFGNAMAVLVVYVVALLLRLVLPFQRLYLLQLKVVFLDFHGLYFLWWQVVFLVHERHVSRLLPTWPYEQPEI
jgi:hypothetical protein